jgi:hypothetical protein
MANILDEIDVIKNIESMYQSNTAFNVLKDFERVLDQLDLYVYKNWEDGELAAGPIIDRHWVTVKFFWTKENMPDPMGGKRLLDYDCRVKYQKSFVVTPRKIVEPDDIRPGTKKGKLDRIPVWIVEIQMPKKLLADLYQTELDDLNDLDVQETEQGEDMQAPPVESLDQSAPDADEGMQA